MSLHKPMLKQLGLKLGLIGTFPLDAGELAGETRLESLRTIYRFRDGVCVEVERRRDCSPVDGRLVGMRLVGWLVGDRLFVHAWQQGARGVLWRPVGGGGTVAKTSSTFAFVIDRAQNARAAAPANPPPARPPMESMTRVIEPTALIATA